MKHEGRKNGPFNLPVNYNSLQWYERRQVREQYIKEQEYKCYYCGCSLKEPAPQHIRDKKINWHLFPSNFMNYPIHLQHNHYTGMTEGAVHNYCNAVMWQYEKR